MKKINIVLHSPEIPQNTGNISRTCACIGAALHIIRLIGFEISDRTLKRAGLDYWDKLEVTYYDCYEDFMKLHGEKPMYYFTSAGKHCYTDVEYPDGVFLVFGKESVGLDREIVEENAERTLRIPMLPTLRCLNLSNSVAVAAYEALRQGGFSDFTLTCD